MFEIFNGRCRESLSVMLAAMLADEKEFQKVRQCSCVHTCVDTSVYVLSYLFTPNRANSRANTGVV